MDVVSYEKNSNGVPYIQLGENVLRFENEELDEAYRQKAEIEIRETKENVENGLKTLRRLITEEKNLNVPLDEEFLLAYLRICNFCPDSAFKVLKKYYKFKQKQPKYFVNLLPREVTQAYEDGVIYFLPKRCESGARVMVVSGGKRWNTKRLPLIELIRSVLIAAKIAMDEPKTQVSGVHIILDGDGFEMHHLWQFNPSVAKVISHMVTECLPIRLVNYNIINESVLCDILYNVFKPFLPDKIKKRIYFHGTDWTSLHKRVDPECLPAQWGGNLKSPECPGRLLNQVLEYYESRYEKVQSYGYVDEKN